ncbi:uncharacterized protein N7503_005842 [Penicillium pulvis]|uniref:uncharacterized protein n=1 Tax=Penicillium pulvis TaxID=1562058 RepID=UPI002546CFC6|nr:uncharacterized protein N7503_005842 [Penicillium pulvis]KAJ5803392.1 hypothetical protein N7503_005842 [Penicillium pulvis]
MASASITRPSHFDEPEVPGILTQTILASPVIKWILPARLRNKNHNDVVFVGEKRVQIKEAIPTGSLEDVAEKTDFPGSIGAAKVLNVSTELPLESQIQSEAAYDGPSQILVLAVDMKELQFVYCCPSKPNEFVTFRRPFPVNVSLEMRFGKHIAVDPKSRAVAVCAPKDFFGIMRLKSPREAQSQMANGTLDPIEEEKFYRIEGTIMFMEFLYPKTADDKNIMLLLIVQLDGVTDAVIYVWKDNERLSAKEPEIHDFKLRKQHRLPTMIVPLTKESSFLVLTTTSMAVYSLDGGARHTKYPFLAPNSDISAASMWTRWARPARNWLYSQSHDGIYLCREDGWIYLLEFGNEGNLENQTSLGQIHCDVDMAFDVLDMGSQGGDFILASGSTGDGGLFVQEARAGPRCVQRFFNWAPVRDGTMVSPVTQSTSYGGIASNRLFACSDSTANRGALHEFRWGFEAQQGFNVPLDDFSSIRDMWTMSEVVNGGVFILLSDPLSTLLLYLNQDMDESIIALEEEQTGLDSRQTLAAGYTHDGVLIQVTEEATHLFALHNTSLNTRVSHKDRVAILTVAVDGPKSAVVTAVRYQEQAFIYMTKIFVTGDDEIRLDVGEPVNIAKEPICLSLQTFGDMTFLFLGNPDGTIDVFLIENNAPAFLFETSITLEGNADLSTVVESFATIRTTSANGTLRAFLLCGLRSGMLVSFEVDFNANNLIGLQQKEAKRIGTTSIRLKEKSTFVLLTCGDELWHVSYRSDCIPSEYSIRRVWITDQSNPAYFPVSIHGFDLIDPHNPEAGAPLGDLFCFADRQLLVCSLSKEAKMVPRRIGLPGKPQKMAYSTILQALIVSYNISSVEDPENPLTKTVKSFIEFVDPDSQSSVVHNNSDPPCWRPESARGETVSCILDWTFERDGKTYYMVAIGTSMPVLYHNDPQQGRLILLAPRRDPFEPYKINCVTQFTRIMQGPIHALAAYEDSLIIGAGNFLVPMASKAASTTWHKTAPTELPSAVVSISIHGNFIFTLTARHSWLVLEIVNQPGLNESSVMLARGWDRIERDGLNHLISHDDQPVLYMSHRGGRVCATTLNETQWSRDTVNKINQPNAIAEAKLHESVLRFVPGNKMDSSLYGFTVLGSIYRFVLPNADELKLLRFLQNICYKVDTICPSAPKQLRRRNPHDLTAPHIDGDILTRLSNRGPDFLENIITSLDSNAVRELFNRLALQAVGNLSVEAVISWLRKMLDITI